MSEQNANETPGTTPNPDGTPVTPVVPSSENASASAETPSQTPETPTPDAPRPSDWKMERIRQQARQKQELNRKLSEKTQYAQGLEDELRKLKAPVRDPNASDEEHSAAVMQHSTTAAALTLEHRRATNEIRTTQSEAQNVEMDSWNERLAEARQEFPDFDAKVQASPIPNLPAQSELGAAIRFAPNGSKMAYLLASNPKEIPRLSTMSYPEILQEFVRLETRFAPRASSPAAPKPPIKPIGGGPGPSGSSEQREWEAKQNARRGPF